jgi:hypothetical protein
MRGDSDAREVRTGQERVSPVAPCGLLAEEGHRKGTTGPMGGSCPMMRYAACPMPFLAGGHNPRSIGHLPDGVRRTPPAIGGLPLNRAPPREPPAR